MRVSIVSDSKLSNAACSLLHFTVNTEYYYSAIVFYIQRPEAIKFFLRVLNCISTVNKDTFTEVKEIV